MILNEKKEGQRYFTVKNLSALRKGKASKHDDDFYCLNCLHSSRKENQPKSHEKVCKCFEIVIPSEKDNIPEFNQYIKSCIIYAGIESLYKKRWMCKQSRETYNNKNR